jgi:hypothetical protein
MFNAAINGVSYDFIQAKNSHINVNTYHKHIKITLKTKLRTKKTVLNIQSSMQKRLKTNCSTHKPKITGDCKCLVALRTMADN